MDYNADYIEQTFFSRPGFKDLVRTVPALAAALRKKQINAFFFC